MDISGDPPMIRRERSQVMLFRRLTALLRGALLVEGIEHRLTKVNHPWTNGQVERMNRTVKDATVKRHHYETHEQLKEHLVQFLTAYNFAKRLKTLQGLTPYEHISKCWQKEPERFKVNPDHHSMGLNT
jgi:transposase InsO family protein